MQPGYRNRSGTEPFAPTNTSVKAPGCSGSSSCHVHRTHVLACVLRDDKGHAGPGCTLCAGCWLRGEG